MRALCLIKVREMKQDLYIDNILISDAQPLLRLSDLWQEKKSFYNKSNARKFYKFAISLTLVAIYLLGSLGYAASQGKLGKTSTGTVNIAVHVNQSFSSFVPNELVLNNDSIKNKISKPFCIAHMGFTHKIPVPYELEVLNFEIQNSNSAEQNIYNVYWKNSEKSLQQLTPGINIQSQSALSHSDEIHQNCIDSGNQLVLKLNKQLSESFEGNLQPGLLILMVSPS